MGDWIKDARSAEGKYTTVTVTGLDGPVTIRRMDVIDFFSSFGSVLPGIGMSAANGGDPATVTSEDVVTNLKVHKWICVNCIVAPAENFAPVFDADTVRFLSPTQMVEVGNAVQAFSGLGGATEGEDGEALAAHFSDDGETGSGDAA